MKTVLETEGLAWNLLETQADAEEESRLGQTAVNVYFSHDVKNGNKATYYGLRAPDGGTLVTARVADVSALPTETDWVNDKTIVVGVRNSDPYADHASAIEALAEHLGVALPPTSWPYGKRAEAVAESEETPDSPVP